jgi:hypothetical protein
MFLCVYWSPKPKKLKVGDYCTGALDERTGNCIILAGSEILIEVYPNGNWRFIYEA